MAEQSSSSGANPEQIQDAEARLDYVKGRIRKSVARFDQGSDREVSLVAVSKTFDADSICPMLAAGQRVFGENRVQEAKGKWPELKAEFDDVSLHLIGPLQTNKVKDAVTLFDVIESVDREKLARALAKEMAAQEKNLPLFVQVNIGREDQKAGIDPSDAVSFVRLCRDELNLDVIGLMCIPPAGDAPGAYFAQLAGLAKQAGLNCLSMGMSSDYEVAVQMGATHVRVGSALFGQRDYPVST